ncbi:ATP-binding protein [Actinomadura luteofluorescens]|uniref:ATP-binding protein n=1 Tax=Actinomadura luteofluorescens TaxID=46163 RepID=UPI0036338BEF
MLPTITEPFQRGTQRTRADGHAGVGLGLAIVHSIVRAHDGTLDLTPALPAASSSRSGFLGGTRGRPTRRRPRAGAGKIR